MIARFVSLIPVVNSNVLLIGRFEVWLTGDVSQLLKTIKNYNETARSVTNMLKANKLRVTYVTIIYIPPGETNEKFYGSVKENNY